MFLKVDTHVRIRGTAEQVWELASNPSNWTASNPMEHFGLHYHSTDNQPQTGVIFTQKERIAGKMANLKGYILYAKKPSMVVWQGIATYKLLFGLFRPRIPEGGILMAEQEGNEVVLSHNVCAYFPDTWFWRLMLYIFRHWLHVEEAVRKHNYQDLLYFKKQIEG